MMMRVMKVMTRERLCSGATCEVKMRMRMRVRVRVRVVAVARLTTKASVCMLSAVNVKVKGGALQASKMGRLC